MDLPQIPLGRRRLDWIHYDYYGLFLDADHALADNHPQPKYGKPLSMSYRTRHSMMTSLFAGCASLVLSACSGKHTIVTEDQRSPWREALIVGSAESPDPILERVKSLVRQGMVKDVVIMESFPVQIRLKAPQDVIDELARIPRVEGNLR